MGNSNNAYITKEANTVNPSDWINKQEQIGLQYDAIARQKEKDEQARQDTLRKEFDSDFEGEFDLSSMGNDAVNKIFTPMAMQSLQDLKEAKDEGEKALDSHGINSKEYKSARTRYDNILKRPNLFKLAFEQTASKLNDHNALVQSGDVYQNPNSIGKLQKLLTEPIKYKQDKEGRYILMHGDKAYTMDEFADKLDFGKSIHKVDSGAIISGVTDKVGTKEYMDRMGYTTNTVTNPWEDYTDPNTNEKKKGIKSVLTNAFESSLTDEVVESVLAGKGEFGYDEMPQETKDKLKAGIVNDWLEIGRGQIEEKTGVKFDSSSANADANRADKDKPKTTETEGNGVFDSIANNRVRPTKSVWGDKVQGKDRWSVPVSKRVKIGSREELQSPTFNTIKDLDSGETYTNSAIESYAYDDKGNLYAKISYTIDEGATETTYDEPNEEGVEYENGKIKNPETKKTAVIRADSDTKRDIANFLGITMDDLWNLGVENYKAKEEKTERPNLEELPDLP